MAVKANYPGLAKALGILLLYASSVLLLFALIYYSRSPLEGGVFGRGAITHGRGYAITKGDARLRMPFYSSREGPHQLWMRLLDAPDRGELSVFFDGEKVGWISPGYSDFKGFEWIKIGELDLTIGEHGVEILNSHGENVIDQIAFRPM